ncbi:MAG: hypothetical protein ACRDCY_18320 [Aeromonas veronii]
MEVKFESLHTCPQEAVDQVCSAVNGEYGDKVLNLVGGWVHYRPSRVGPVLRLPAANGNRKVTVLVWLEETKQEPSQIFTSAELARIQQLTSGSVMIPHNPATDKALHAKVTELLKETK